MGRCRSQRLLVAIFLTYAALPAARAAPAPDRPRPNVLFVAIDDLNDWVGPLGGHPQVKTPNLDRLAARGTVFTNAHCQAALCNPSRASLLTGLRPTTTGIYALQPWLRASPALRGHVTLPQHFAAHGYRTLSTGKIYHDGYPPKDARADGGEFTAWGPAGSHGPQPPRKFVDTPARIPLMDWGVFPETDAQQEDHKLATWAVEQLRAHAAAAPSAGDASRKPLFLAVGFRRPHVPCYAPQRWFDLYPDASLAMPPVKEDDRADVPPFAWHLHWKLPEPRLAWLRRAGEWRPHVRAYLACVSFVDAQVGRLLDALDATGLAKDTVVVLWSDHGYHLGEKGISGKNTLWERSTRVPLIFAGPGVAPGGKCAEPAELLDLYPTLSALCGLPAPKAALDGRSLAPQLRDPAAPREHPAITSAGPGNHAVRDRRWRYVRYADGSEELYDHAADPNEWTNLAADPRHAEEKTRLAKWLPARSEPPLPGSKARLIELKDGTVYWETQPIPAGAPVPE